MKKYIIGFVIIASLLLSAGSVGKAADPVDHFVTHTLSYSQDIAYVIALYNGGMVADKDLVKQVKLLNPHIKKYVEGERVIVPVFD